MPRLRRSNIAGPGLSRRRCGKGFVYLSVDGDKLTDDAFLTRIGELAIPPAWSDVWICPWANGHLQAIGTDAAGRRQYRYHDAWRMRRDQEKFDRILTFGRALPQLRRSVAADLSTSGLRERRVLAAGVRLLDIGYFRVGGEEYAEEHETFGVATLQVRHVSVDGADVVFSYSAKGSIARTVTVSDPDIRRLVQSLLRRSRPQKDDFLAWKHGHEWIDVRASDLNEYIKRTIGDQFSAKDFRTWSATVLAATELAAHGGEMASERERKRALRVSVAQVAEILGNTAAVCRSSYIDPRVIDCFDSGDTIAAALPRGGKASGPRTRRRVEQAVIAMLGDAIPQAA